jgi:hypothetical protein
MTANTSPAMPEAEVARLRECYEAAEVILEYGSGGSTRIAAALPGKYVMSVESDAVWARDLRREISASSPRSLVTVYHVDIGATGPWGRPLDDSGWRGFHRYPNAIWDESFFRHPDVVLIDGRFRAACLMAVVLRAERPVRVLFDDYAERPKYHRVEHVVRPVRRFGRMAEFEIVPGMARPEAIGVVVAQFFDATIHSKEPMDYTLDPVEAEALTRLRGTMEGETS